LEWDDVSICFSSGRGCLSKSYIIRYNKTNAHMCSF
jgi:hypothetical protein